MYNYYAYYSDQTVNESNSTPQQNKKESLDAF